ncbi:MAG TPA: hypothetical protein VM598_02905, partial [Bdellovibrionota bacterium]|nr:hypothetical protein [Bdellovibrionota bacterium]
MESGTDKSETAQPPSAQVRPGDETQVLVESLKDRLSALVVCFSHSWGGLEQVAANDAVDVASLGLGVRVLCLRDTPIHQNLMNRESVTVVPLDFHPRNYFDLKLKRCLEELIGSGVNLIHT